MNTPYADLVGLCQFLPGPASSQVGFSIGLMRAGYRGGLAAWTGFTLPSAIVLVLFAYGAGALGGPAGSGLLHGLKFVAVAIVAQAVWGMARTLCPDRERASIALVAALIILFSSASVAQIGAIAARRYRGPVALPAAPPTRPVTSPCRSRAPRAWCLTAFLVLLVGLPVLRGLASAGHRSVRRFLPLRRAGVRRRPCGPAATARRVRDPGLGQRRFISRRLRRGAGRAGPLFTFAAYLGTVVSPTPHGMAGAALGLIGIFLPGILSCLERFRSGTVSASAPTRRR